MMAGLRIAGVDGCSGGWVVVTGNDGFDELEVLVVSRFAQLFQMAVQPNIVCVDIPIGLATSGPRDADVQSRKLVGVRRSSVFPAPERPLLAFARSDGLGREDGYAITNEWSWMHLGHGISKQNYNILGKIAEVDDFLGERPHLRVTDVRPTVSTATSLVFEIHPEMSFLEMNDGEPLPSPKRQSDGSAQRLGLLKRNIGMAVTRLSLHSGAKQDDLHDALAALWTAARIARGDEQRVPADAKRDALGLDIAIRY